MILDDLIALSAVIFEVVFMAFFYIFAGIINVCIFLLELIIGIFVKGYSIKRVPRREWRKKSSEKLSEPEKQKLSKVQLWSFIVILAAVLSFSAYQMLKEKEILFVATDGKSLPLAKIVITDSDGVKSRRTDSSGVLKVPRFGLVSLKIADARYKEEIWSGEEIKERIIVKRSMLGSGLDKISNMLLKQEE